MSQNNTDLSKERSIREKSSGQIKRTDVNILLNRVRLDKKRDFQKNILFSIFLVSLICSIAIYLII